MNCDLEKSVVRLINRMMRTGKIPNKTAAECLVIHVLDNLNIDIEATIDSYLDKWEAK